MKKRDYTDYLIDIKSECEFLINESNKIDYNTFASSDTLIRAFIRSLEVIGETTKYIPSYHRNKYPDIQWKKHYRKCETFLFTSISAWTIMLYGLLSKIKYLYSMMLSKK